MQIDLNFVTFFSLFRDMGLVETLTKFIPEFKVKNEYGKIKSSILIIFLIEISASILIVVILFTLSSFLAANFFKDPLAVNILPFVLIWFLLMTVVYIIRACLHGLQETFLYSSVDFISSFLLLVFIWIFFYMDLGIMSAVYSYALTSIFLVVLYFFVLKRTAPKVFSSKTYLSKPLLSKILKFGIPVMFTGAGFFVLSYMDTIMITYFRTLEEVGLYNAALPTAKLLQYFAVGIGAIIFPLSSDLWTRGEKNKLKLGMEMLYKYCILAILPITFFMGLYSSSILGILFGPVYTSAFLSMQILVFGFMFFVIANLNSVVISGIGFPKKNIAIIYPGMILNIILNLILIPQMGIVGAAIATTSSFLLMLILSIRTILKIFYFKIPYSSIGKAIFSLICIVFIMNFISTKNSINLLHLMALFAVFIIAYFGLLVYFRVINYREIKNIAMQLK